MRVDREAFGLVISEIPRTGDEKNTELVLTDTTTDPVKTHIISIDLDILGVMGDGGTGVGKADSTFIVSMCVSRGYGSRHY